MIFFTLVYGLEILGPNIGMMWMCYTIQVILVVMDYMCVDNNGCMWGHKNA